MSKHYDVIIVGGGIVGFSTAMQLLQHDRSLKVAVLEKEASVGFHQTGHNSGVIHAGVYYKPGSLKAKFCIKGNQATTAFCTEHKIPFRVPGKLIVATNDEELEWMHALKERCDANRLTVQMLNRHEVEERQAGINAAGGILVHETGIVNWKTVCQKYAEIYQSLGGDIYFNQTVCGINETNSGVIIHTNTSEKYECGYLITCGGLFSDRLVKLSGINADFKIIPFRGEYYQLDSRYNNFFKHLIYPVPNPALPFLGVHFTPQMSDIVTVGPSALLAFSREGYQWKAFQWGDCWEILSYPGTWKIIKKHFKSTLNELKGSLFKKFYLQAVQKYFPQIVASDLFYYPAGVRAQAVTRSGELIEEFLFKETPRILHTCNAPSPAATSSLPIGEYITEIFIKKLNYKE